MNEQWPSERRAGTRGANNDSSFKTAPEFLELLSLFRSGQFNAFNEVVDLILEDGVELSELEQRLARISDDFVAAFPDSNLMLLTLACAEALARAPSPQTWLKVNALKYHSWQLKHWLGEAMLACATTQRFAFDAYVQLAKDVLAALENFSIHHKSDQVNNERRGAWAHWNECQNKLDEIWGELRGWHGIRIYESEMPLFEVFYKLNQDEFVETISKSTNPYLVSALLFAAGISAFDSRFSDWKQMVIASPGPFEVDGRWNGSVLMPLLLVDARNQLLKVRQNFAIPDLTDEEVNAGKHEVIRTAELIGGVLALRHDATLIFARWAPWLMRQILMYTEKDVADVKSAAFADDALIDVIGKKLDGASLPQESPGDAQLWESWCYRCALVSFAYNRHIKVPDWTSFENEWSMSPDDWASTKGSLLRERASRFTGQNKEIPGIAANFLAYPITQSPSPAQSWIGLWNNAFAMREIVEFGDADADTDEYSSRSEAGRLLILLFRIGLATFDQCAAQCSDNKSAESRSLTKLFQALHYAAKEMREVDSTLNRDEWLLISQHLVVRRMIWEGSPESETSARTFQVFDNMDAPTVPCMLAEAKGNVVELVSLLQSLSLNDADRSKLSGFLDSASIDIASVLHSMRTLNCYHPRKYPIDEAQLRKLVPH